MLTPCMPHPLPSGPTASLSLAQVKELDLGRKEKPDFFGCKATITFARKENCLYKVFLTHQLLEGIGIICISASFSSLSRCLYLWGTCFNIVGCL